MQTYEDIKQIVEDKLINKTEYRTYEELSEILFGEGNCFCETEVRKRMYGMKSLIDIIEAERDHEFTPDDRLQQIKQEKENLEKLKVQLQDERVVRNKQIRTDARVEQKLDYLEDMLRSYCADKYTASPLLSTVSTFADNDLLVLLSDLHIGQSFSSYWGKYDTEIAQKRMDEYLGRICEIGEKNHSENCYVAILGDLISGNIHKSIQVTNRENVISQIKIVSELITGFCYELSKHFSNVVISNVSGNHSRIDKKDDAIHDERLDDLVGWIVKNSLMHIDNVKYIDNDTDIGISSFNIRGKDYVLVHGDYDQFSSAGVSNLCMMLHKIPYAILFGHMHHCSIDETNGIKMIRGGSLAGTGDQYTIEKRLNGDPSQMVCVCTTDGVLAYYTVQLS